MLSALLTQDARARRMSFCRLVDYSFALLIVKNCLVYISEYVIIVISYILFVVINEYIAVGRIAAVKPEKAQQIENMIIRLHQQGQIQPKLDEDALVRLLDRISDAASKQTIKVKGKHMVHIILVFDMLCGL